ncbi:MAG: DNA repair protein RadC [Alphaproteobacteria bacterium]|nr:DNA repair protein RadC [Alphaproteobacteria bacterium]
MDQEDKKLHEGHRQRLRQRFLKDEGASMPEYELLELMLTFVLPRQDMKPKAKKLIERFGSLAKVLSASQEVLREYGLSEIVIAALKSYMTVSTLMHLQALKESKDNVLKNPDKMLEYCRSIVAHNMQEEFHVIFLDSGLAVINEEVMAHGTADSVAVHPKEILRRALNYGATSVILFHNHPGGHAKPSNADIALTQQIVQLLETADIFVNDHLIITEDNYFSFQSNGLMDNIRRHIKNALT